jgi:hypothetical protein
MMFAPHAPPATMSAPQDPLTHPAGTATVG